MQENGVYSGNVQRPTSLDPYSTQVRKKIQKLQGKGWQKKIQNTAIQCSSNLWQSSCKKFNTLFRKSIGRRKQKNERFSKIWGRFTWQEGHVHASHFGKMKKPKFLVLSCTGKIIVFTICSQFMHNTCTGCGLHFEAWCIRHSNASSSRK